MSLTLWLKRWWKRVEGCHDVVVRMRRQDGGFLRRNGGRLVVAEALMGTVAQ